MLEGVQIELCKGPNREPLIISGQVELSKEWQLVLAHTPPVGTTLRICRVESMRVRGLGLCNIRAERKKRGMTHLMSSVCVGSADGTDIHRWDYEYPLSLSQDDLLLLWARIPPRSRWARFKDWWHGYKPEYTLRLSAYVELLRGEEG